MWCMKGIRIDSTENVLCKPTWNSYWPPGTHNDVVLWSSKLNTVVYRHGKIDSDRAWVTLARGPWEAGRWREVGGLVTGVAAEIATVAE